MNKFERRKERIILDLKDLKDERHLDYDSKEVIEDAIKNLESKYFNDTEL